MWTYLVCLHGLEMSFYSLETSLVVLSIFIIFSSTKKLLEMDKISQAKLKRNVRSNLFSSLFAKS